MIKMCFSFMPIMFTSLSTESENIWRGLDAKFTELENIWRGLDAKFTECDTQ